MATTDRTAWQPAVLKALGRMTAAARAVNKAFETFHEVLRGPHKHRTDQGE